MTNYEDTCVECAGDLGEDWRYTRGDLMDWRICAKCYGEPFIESENN